MNLNKVVWYNLAGQTRHVQHKYFIRHSLPRPGIFSLIHVSLIVGFPLYWKWRSKCLFIISDYY